MTLNERFVGGNPQVLLFLFCLFCVILICFTDIVQTWLEKKNGGHDQKLGLARACGGTAVPTHQHTKTKKVFPFFPHSNNTTSFIFKLLSLNLHYLNLQIFITPQKLHQTQQFLTQIISKHHSKHKPTIKTNFHPPKPQIHQIRNPQKPQSSSLNSKTLLKPQTHH